MNQFFRSTLKTIGTGLLVLAPIYLAALLVLKAMDSLSVVVAPLYGLLPKWLPGARILSLLLVITSCFLTGLGIQTQSGHRIWERIEKSLFERIPGYPLLRSLTHRLAGETEGTAWKPALAEIEHALVPSFIIEELDDGRFTVFVPSVPTPLAGAVYILTPDRVHPLSISFIQAVRLISRWGAGCKDVLAAIEQKRAA